MPLAGGIFFIKWSVVSGQWSVVGGQWSVVSGHWSVGVTFHFLMLSSFFSP